MNRLLAALAALTITATAFGQGKAPRFPDMLASSKTRAHVNIPGTHVYLRMPPGFTPAAGMPAFQKGNTGLIQAMDLSGGNYYTNAARFSREKFESSGVKVLEFKELKLNGLPGKVCLIQGDSQSLVYNFVFGDSTFSTMIVGAYAAGDSITGLQIRQALTTVFYDKAHRIDPFAIAPFRLDDSKSTYKFATFTASMYMYTPGGAFRAQGENVPALLVMSFPADDKSLKETGDNMLQGIEVKALKSESDQDQNGFRSLRRELLTDNHGKPGFVFQQIVRIDGNLVILQGRATDAFEANAAEFRKLAATIRRP